MLLCRAFLDFDKKNVVILRSNWLQALCLHTKTSLAIFSPIYLQLPREVVAGTTARSPPPHAPGVRQDETPSSSCKVILFLTRAQTRDPYPMLGVRGWIWQFGLALH